MPSPPEDLLDAVTRAFDDNAELKIIARRELEEAISGAPETGDSHGDMRARLDAVDARPSRVPSWPLVVMAVASLALFSWTIWSFYSKRHEIRWFEGIANFFYSEIPNEKLTKGLTPSQQLLLLGNPDSSPEGARMKALWQSEPANPAYFTEHARTWVAREKTMPPDLMDEARRLQPDNGYFHYLAAVATSEKCVEEIRVPRKKGDPPQPKQYRILDETRWRQTIGHLHDAAAAPAFQSYEKDLIRRRLDLLPEPHDILSIAPKADYLFGDKVSDVRGFSLHRVVSAGAEDCLKRGDREGLLKLHETWDELLRRRLEDERPSGIQTLLLRSYVSGPLDNFIAAADGLDLPELAAKLRTRKELLADEHSPLRQAIGTNEAKLRAKLHGGLFLDQSPLLEPLTDAEMRPLRQAEHAIMDRLAALAGWVILALMAVLTACFRFRASGVAKRLSGRLSSLITGRDILQILAAGVLLPFLLSLVVIHFTPLGGRGWNFHTHGGLILVGQLLAVVFLMLLIPLILARRRLSQRAGRLGLHGRPSVFGWLAVAGCALAIPLFYTAQRVMVPSQLMDSGDYIGDFSFIDLDPGQAARPGAIWLWVAIGLLAAAALYGLVTMARGLFSKRQHLMRRSILSRMLVPAYLAGTLVLAIAMPAYHAAERYWFARDTLMDFAPEYHGLSRSEGRLLQLDQAKLLEVLTRER